MFRTLKKLAVVAGLLLAAATPAVAQTGSVSGRVTDQATGAGIAGARVQAVSGTRSAGAAITDDNGAFTITDVPAGTYALVTTRVGYQLARVEGVSVGAGATARADIAVTEMPSQLEEVVTTASRAPEKVIDAPASVQVVNQQEINERPAVNVADHVAALPGIDVARGGLLQSNIVARGFNNIFSGSLLTLTDNRFAFVPSLRANIPYLFTTPNEDIERIEVVLGPGAALYGPNTAGGVMHLITRSPFTSQGTTITVDGGERSLFRGAIRHAGAPTQKFGYKFSYDFFTGRDWPQFERDTLERAERDLGVRRHGGEFRVDFRPTPASELIGTYGRTQAVNAVEPTGLGPGQVKDWVYQTFQLRGRLNRLFAQAFINMSDAGETFLLRTLEPIVDESRQYVFQVQHGSDFGALAAVGPRQSFLYGFDFQHTDPRTGGTINGRNEEDDNIREVGGYVHSVTRLSPRLEFTAAARVDKHSEVEDPIFSPRLALVFKPTGNQNFRATYNRAFSTPSTNNLFLDLIAGRVPRSGPQLYGVRALGVPTTGLSFRRDCTGGLDGLCMRVPTALGGNPTTFVPASAAAFYPAAFLAARSNIIANLTASFVAAGLPQATAQAQATAIATFLGSLRPTGAQVGTQLRVLNPANATFTNVAPADLRDVGRITPTTNQTYEIGYKGILADRLQLAVDVWRENRQNFVGPLIVETPNVFLDAASLGAYLAGQLAAIPTLTAAQRAQIAQAVAGGIGGVSGSSAAPGVPLGVVNFDHPLSAQSDIIVTYRNFGELTVWGSDIAAELLLNRGLSLFGTYSWVNKGFFPREEVGGVQDISLNAPTNKRAFAVRYRDVPRGIGSELRVRSVTQFPVYSFINGVIESYTLVDAMVSLRPSFLPNVMWSISATNLLDEKHRQFVGGGEIGRLVMTRLQYTF